MATTGKISKDVMDEALYAVQDFRIRCLVDAKNEIVETGRYSAADVDAMVLALFDEEREKYRLYRHVRASGSVPYEALVAYGGQAGLTPFTLLKHLYELAREHLLELEEEEGAITAARVTPRETREVKSVYVPVTEFSTPFCAGCGLCQGICPVDCLTVQNGVLSIDEEQCIHCGLCFSVCPRSFLPKQIVNWAVQMDVALPDDLSIGPVQEAYSGRVTDAALREVVQDGGVVSGLLVHAFQAGLIDAALGAKMSSTPWLPEPFLMTSAEDVRLAAGTKYANNPTLQLVSEIGEYEHVAAVGTPCMMQALRKATAYPAGIPALAKIQYRIGIFCMESFSYDSILEIARVLETEITAIKKMDINKGKFFVHTTSGETKEVPIKEITHLARHECHFCYDLTSENADVSVGSIGSPSGWSTILVRNARGKELLDGAVAAGILEVKPLAEVKPGMFLVKKIAGFKNKGYQRAKTKALEEDHAIPGYYP